MKSARVALVQRSSGLCRSPGLRCTQRCSTGTHRHQFHATRCEGHQGDRRAGAQPHMWGAPGLVKAPSEVRTESNMNTGLWGTQLVRGCWR